MLVGYPGKMATPTATDGGTGTTASVAFTAVSGATNYQVLSTPGSFTATGTTSPLTVSGLTAGTAYTFQVQSQNAYGYGGYSDASNSITPTVPTSYESIATVTATGSQSTLTFSSIPGTYKHLQIRGIANDGSDNGIVLRFNSDTGANYTQHRLSGNGTSASAAGSTGNSSAANIGWASGATNVYGASIIDIIDYASTSKYKTVRTFMGVDANASGGNTGAVYLSSNLWLSTAAVTSVSIIDPVLNFTAGTTFALYGVKG